MKKLIIWLLLIAIAFGLWVGMARIHINGTFVINKGDSFPVFLNQLSRRDQTSLKVYLLTHTVDFTKLQVGSYSFSGSYSKADFIATVLEGPSQNYTRYTVLEGWSSYDIDADLAKKGFIQPGEYLSYIADRGTISEYAQGYEFIREIPSGEQASLEGYLYPDTYHLDSNQDVIPQLVKLQLQAFSDKIRGPLSADIQGIDLSWQEMLTLASVVEKEEKRKENKATVAGIFLKRLDIGMKLDADITLCYGLKQPYETCTPSVIVQHLDDGNNPYNTRVVGGLPPQPISNPSAETVQEVLQYQKTNYLYYLHDMQGNIHYGTSLEEHAANKAKYLQ